MEKFLAYRAICLKQLDILMSFSIFTIGYVFFYLSVVSRQSEEVFSVINNTVATVVISVLYGLYHNLRLNKADFYKSAVIRTYKFTKHYRKSIGLFKKHTAQLRVAVWLVILMYPAAYTVNFIYTSSTVLLPIIVSMLSGRGVTEFQLYKSSLLKTFVLSTICFGFVIFLYAFTYTAPTTETMNFSSYSGMFINLVFCGFFGSYFIAWVEVASDKMLALFSPRT